MTAAPEGSPKFELSLVQLLAGCLAALSAAVLASFFGVAGTLIGTAIGSIVGTAGTAIYSNWIRRTEARLRYLRRQGAGLPAAPPAAALPHLTGRNWAMVGVAAGAAFVAALMVVTGVEAAVGKELSALVTGQKQHGSSRTTIGALTGGETTRVSPTPTAEPSSSSSPGFGGFPPVTPTATPDSTASPTPGAGASTSPSPSAQPTASP